MEGFLRETLAREDRPCAAPTAVAIAACAVAFALAPSTSAGAIPPPLNLVANGGFESAAFSRPIGLSAWDCARGTAPASPGAFGSYALSGTPTERSRARCTQTIPVQPNSVYGLSALVRGGPAFLGSDFGSVSAPASAEWTQLSTRFTTGPTTSVVRIFLHGERGGAPYSADDVRMFGNHSALRKPVAPTDLTIDYATSHSVRLLFTGAPGSSLNRVYAGDTAVWFGSMGGAAVVNGLRPGTSYRFSMTGSNNAGESRRSKAVVVVTPVSAAPPHAVRGLGATSLPGGVFLAWEAVAPATDGYHVSERWHHDHQTSELRDRIEAFNTEAEARTLPSA
jgi:hypothetical protein